MAWISDNRYLTESEMKNNTNEIESYLVSKGWTLNAIAGMLGNMEIESTINPGIWQNLDENNMNVGFGLVQWTPATNFTDWATKNRYIWGDGNAQLKWIDEETVTFGQWIETEDYPMSFENFKVSTSPPENLASVFLKNFERAGVEKESDRREKARKWYNYMLSGDSPSNPGTPSQTSKRKNFNFILFNRHRRRILK